MGWVFILCGREYDEVKLKCEKPSAKTHIIVHFTRGVEEGGVAAVLFVHLENGTMEGGSPLSGAQSGGGW